MSGDDHDPPSPGQTEAGQTTMENNESSEKAAAKGAESTPAESIETPEASVPAKDEEHKDSPPAEATEPSEPEAKPTEASGETPKSEPEAEASQENLKSEDNSSSEGQAKAASQGDGEASKPVSADPAGEFTLESPEVLSMAQETGVSPKQPWPFISAKQP